MTDRQPVITYEVLTVRPDGSHTLDTSFPARAQAEQRMNARAQGRTDQRGRPVDDEGRPVVVEKVVE